MRAPFPFEIWAAGMQLAHLAAETQAVMAFRLMGMAGIWSVAPTEGRRMLSEKPGAFVESASAASHAALSGKRPDQIVTAAIKPLRDKTRRNSRRLARRGPNLRHL